MILHGYYRSTAAWRVRIALNLKGLAAEHRFRHLRRGEQRDEGYMRLNPQGLVPALELDPDAHRDLVLHKGRGCPACFQTGYLGRTGIFEIMAIGDELRDLIFQQIPKDVLRRVAVDLGMRTLKHSAVDKILEGVTTPEEAYRVVSF